MHETVTIVAKYFVVLPVIGYAWVFLRIAPGERRRFLITTIVCVAAALLLVKLATSVYHDPRPFMRDGVTPYFASSTDNGFPSDHATFSALLALLVYGVSRKLGLALGLIAILIGAARVLGGVHHTLDIIGGFVIAVASYAIASGAIRLLASKVPRKGE